MANERELHPGEAAPHTGIYELMNVLGTPAERSVERQQGELLPPAPLQFHWVLLKRLAQR